ncbi:MAG: adenylate/guanylate cyclase domain-containing protein [Bdellovibrio sp.]
MKANHISYLLGLVVTGLFFLLARNFYNYQHLPQEEQNPKSLVGFLETLDLKMLDLKMHIRGERASSAPVALIAVDDRSVEEVGRWPWDRHLMAQLTESVFRDGAKALGFDMIFSEPQGGDLSADQTLAQTLTRYRDKVVAGSFSEPVGDAWFPYQDYCMNEAFIRANGGDVVRLNASFIVEDRADPYESVPFGEALNPLFEALEKAYEPLIIKDELKLSSMASLSEAQKRFLKSELAKKNFEFCSLWLTPQDTTSMSAAYAKIFSVPIEKVPEVLKKFKQSVLRHPLPSSWNWVANLPSIQEGLDYNASFNAFQDSDGSVRRLPLFYRTGNRMGTSFVPTLALQTYLTAMGYRAHVVIDRSKTDSHLKEIKEFEILDPSQEPERKVFSLATDRYSFMRINYFGGAFSVPHVSAREILRDSSTIRIIQKRWHAKEKKWQPYHSEVSRKEFLKDRILLIGATATGVYDLRVTPFEKNFPGPEIHAQALAQLYEQQFLRPWEREAQIMPWIILLLGLLLSVLLTWTGAVSGLLISGLALILIEVVDFVLFLKMQMLLSVLLPLFLLIVLNFVIQTFKYLTEEKKKKELKTTFAKYVSPAIVDEVLKAPENLELGGRKQRMTVFFSDVRGFTTLSETLDPQKLSEVLNRYLTPMTEIVFHNKGTLDKYMGDAVMAFFGAPIPYENHAQEACRTALQSLRKLEQLRAEFQKEGLPPLDMGIGINTGEMSVGNMGSRIVRNYTVMGDAVNLGSRLEGINKEYGTRVIISEFTYEDVKDRFVCREIDKVKVKGKNKPVRIYELIAEGKVETSRQEMLSSFDAAYASYQNGDFKQALSQFEMLSEKDPVSAVYKERCHEFISNPPSSDWDGVFVMNRK